MATDESALRLVEVSRQFAAAAGPVHAVRGVSLSIGRGEVVGVLGPNGAGKTTTVKMSATLLEPSSGSVFVAGIDAVADPRRARKHLGLVLGGDRGFYLRASARENLDFFGELQGVSSRRRRRTDEMLDLVGLSKVGRDRVETFSRGMKQRLHIARALLADPTLVLLDEPSIGLDPEGARDLHDIIGRLRDEGRGVLLTTHYMGEAEELSDRLVVIAAGRLVAEGSARDIAVEAGIGRVTSLSTTGSHDPTELLVKLTGVVHVASGERFGVRSTEIVWADGAVIPASLDHVLEGTTVLSRVDRAASLEESYLAFLERQRTTAERSPS